MDIDRLKKDYSVKPDPSNNYIAIRVINGLGNRMRAFAFYKTLARHLNRDFYLCWEESIGFDKTGFRELFDMPNVNLITLEEFEIRRNYSIDLNDFIPSKCKQHEEFKGNKNFNADSHRNEVKRNCKKYDFDLHKFGNKKFSDIPLTIETSDIIWEDECFGIYAQYLKTLQRLKLNKNVEELIESVCSNYNNYTYGIHIRMGDAIQKHNPDSHNYIESRTDSYFVDIMLKLSKENEKAKFFLATDDEPIFTKLKVVFGDRIVHNPNKKFELSEYNKPKRGQIDAIIDMYCLSRTKKIYGTTWSSFSSIASHVGGKELILKK